MKIKLLILTIIAVFAMSTVAFADADDNPGAEIDNPWASLFTKPADTQTTKAPSSKPAKVEVAKAVKKKKSAKKITVTLKKVNGAKGYQVAVYSSKKKAKNNKKAIVKKITKKTKVTIKSKKLKNKKKLFVRARAYTINGKKKVFGDWSKVVKVKIKK